LRAAGFATEPLHAGLSYHFAIKARREGDAETTPQED
jgi:hypothetical protein